MDNKLLVSLKVDEQTGDHYFDISDIEHLFENPEDIDHYELSADTDGELLFKFFDSNNNLIKVKNSL